MQKYIELFPLLISLYQSYCSYRDSNNRNKTNPLYFLKVYTTTYNKNLKNMLLIIDNKVTVHDKLTKSFALYCRM